VHAALAKLDKLVNEEVLLTVAQTLVVAQEVSSSVREMQSDVMAVGSDVQTVEIVVREIAVDLDSGVSVLRCV
jgi:hypothetical protein